MTRDDFFIDRRQQAELRQKLAAIPVLVEELAITITRQARIQKSALGRLKRQKPGSRLPFHLAAAQANDDLHDCLVTWTRAVCEQRRIRYRGHDDHLSLARFLHAHVVPLALIESAPEALADITARVDECRRQIDLPPDDDVVIDAERVREANRQVLTAAQIERIAPQLGSLGDRLDERRIRGLVRARRLRPCAWDGETVFFRLGDVLHAHHVKDDGRQGWERLRDRITR